MESDLWSNHTDCKDGEGKAKKRYYSLQEAQNTALYLQEEKGIELRVYRCDKCGYYHLTKNNVNFLSDCGSGN